MANKNIASIISSINKEFGENSIGFATEVSSEIADRVSTGSIQLDIDLGGGIPIGRFIEVSGALSSTKTTQVLHVIKNAQEKGLVCAYLDVENTTDKSYFQKVGVDIDNLIYSNPDGLEECTEMLLKLQRSGKVDIAVIDSIESLTPTKERDSAMDETTKLGLKATLLNEYFRKFQSANNRLKREGLKPFTLIGINQLREKMTQYGDPEFAPGGRGKGFYASIDLRLRRGEWITEGSGNNKSIVGQVVKYKINKNKTGVPLKSGEFDFYFDKNEQGIPETGIDNFKSIVVAGVEFGIIERKGAWFYYGEEKFNGLAKLIEFLKEKPEEIGEIKETILKLVKEVQ